MLETAVPFSVRGGWKKGASDPRWALAVAILGSSMAFLDATVINVALPVIQRDLGVTVDLVQWVVEAYALLLSSLVLVGGALGDRLGRKRVFSIGVAIFALASIGCGAAPSAPWLIFARAVQGIGGALLVPGSLSLISAAYPEKQRGAAIGTWSAFSAMTSAIGPVAGGFIVAHGSWRWLFFFNVPIAIVVIVLTTLRVAETRDEDAPPHMDFLGATLVTLGLGVMVYALVDSANVAGARRMWPLLALGAVLLVVFVIVEARSRAPMVPLTLFRTRAFAGANLLTLLLYGALGGGLFYLPFNLIQVQGYGPTAAGAALLPFVLLVSAMSRAAGAFAARRGPRLPLIVGPILAASGFALLAIPAIGGSYFTTFFPGIVVIGIGMGITVAPLTTTVMGSVDARRGGVASGVNNAIARAAGLIAIAGLGVVLVARFDQMLDQRIAALHPSSAIEQVVALQRARLGDPDLSAVHDEALRRSLRAAFNDAYVSGFRTLMIACAILAALASLAAFALIRSPVPSKQRAAEHTPR